MRQFWLLLLILLSGCSAELSSPDYAAYTWTYDPTATLDTVYTGAALTLGSRLEFTEGTVVVRNPYRSRSIFPIDLRRPGIPDSFTHFLTVATISETEIEVTSHVPDRPTVTKSYFRRELAIDTVAIDELLNRAYRVEFPGRDTVDLHFSLGDPGGDDRFNVVLVTARRPPKDTTSFSYDRYGLTNRVPVRLRYSEGVALSGLGRLDEADGRSNAHYTIHRDKNGELIIRYLIRHGNLRQLRELPLVPLPPVVPEVIQVSDVVNLLNGGKFSVDSKIIFPDSAGIHTLRPGDDRAVAVADLDQLDFLFSPNGDFALLNGNRQVEFCHWALSPDRRMLQFYDGEIPERGGVDILSYTENGMIFQYPLSVITPVQSDSEYTTYAEVLARVRVVLR